MTRVELGTHGSRVLIAVAVAGGLGIVLAFTGLSPWLLWASAWAALVLALSTAMPVVLAVAGAFVFPMALWVVLARVLQPVPVGLDLKAHVVLVVLFALALGLAWRRRALLPSIDGRMRRALFALAPVSTIVLALVIYTQAFPVRGVAWAMHNDSVWNTVATRLMVMDEGVDVAAHPNVAPGVSAMMSAATSAGRSGLPADAVLLHDLQLQSQFWLLAMLATAVLVGLAVAARIRRMRPLPAVVAVVAATLLPFSWFVAGNAMQFGFINSTLALVLLLAAWIAWERLAVSPWGALAVLSASIVMMLATWAPLAVIPLGLTVVALFRLGRAWWSDLRARGWLALILVALPVPAYGLAITLGDLAREGDALGSNGGIFPVSPTSIVVAFAALLFAATVRGVLQSAWSDVIGAVVVIAASTLALAYLLVQRLDADFLWGYYPAKFGWVVMAFAIIVFTVVLASTIDAAPRRQPLLASVAAVLVIAFMTLVPPNRATFLPLASVAGLGPLAVDETTVNTLLELFDDDQHRLVASLHGNSSDRFVNNWLIQLGTRDGAEPVRAFAYDLDPTSPSRLCEAATAWNGDVEVFTADPDLVEALDSCSAVSDVIVVD
jgi:hypothetical protein